MGVGTAFVAENVRDTSTENSTNSFTTVGTNFYHKQLELSTVQAIRRFDYS